MVWKQSCPKKCRHLRDNFHLDGISIYPDMASQIQNNLFSVGSGDRELNYFEDSKDRLKAAR